MLKYLENIETKMLQTIFEYNKLNKAELKAEEKEVIKEHRSGFMDPSSAIGKLSRSKTKANKMRLTKMVVKSNI